LCLLVAGGYWLSHTSQLDDLLLNAAALLFVLDLDELFFKTVVPPFAKQIMSHLEPLRRPKDRMLHGLSWRPPFVLFVVCVYICLMVTMLVRPIHQRMLVVQSTMCDSKTNLDFVVDVNKHLNAPVVSLTNHYKDRRADTLMNRTLRNRVVHDFAGVAGANPYGYDWSSRAKLSNFVKNWRDNLEPPVTKRYNSSATFLANDDLSFFGYLNEAEMVSYPGCVDTLAEDGRFSDSLVLGLQFMSGRFNAKHCAEFADLCSDHFQGRVVRALCSKTCRCSTHNSSLYVRDGCKPACLDELLTELSYPGIAADCVDKGPDSQFFNGPLAASYFNHFEKAMKLPSGVLNVEVFRKKGCEALVLYDDNTSALHGLASKYWAPVADRLCGRVPGTNLALPEVAYNTLRWICPVTCGCTFDLHDDCPHSCRHGAYVAKNPCSGYGLCPNGTQLHAHRLVDHNVTCGEMDRFMATSEDAHVCELIRFLHESACCVSPAR